LAILYSFTPHKMRQGVTLEPASGFIAAPLGGGSS
jgi:hypothetical protein